MREYASDEGNTESTTTMRLHVGGGSPALADAGAGIHWHMNLDNRDRFVADDDREKVISYVRLSERPGGAREYFADGATPANRLPARRRRMDCMDCHNRPAHTMFFIAGAGRSTPRSRRGGSRGRLPFVRREAVAAVRADYPGPCRCAGRRSRRGWTVLRGSRGTSIRGWCAARLRPRRRSGRATSFRR